MKKILLLIALLVLSFFLGYYVKTLTEKKPAFEIDAKPVVEKVERKGVSGVAGIFFKCKDPQKVKAWYKEHLGFNTNAYGALFEWEEGPAPSRMGSLQWSPFPETTDYFEPSKKAFMINYRVENLDELVDQLIAGGVTPLDSIATYEYGKFIHLMDIEGNKIELYEPNYEYGKEE